MSAASPAPLDRMVALRGAAYGSLVAVPAAMANVVLAAQEPKPGGALNATLVLMLLGFGLAGVAAGREAADRPRGHGVLSAAITAVPVQVMGILGRLDRGDGVAPATIVIIAVLALVAGALGSRVGAARRARALAKEEPS